MKLLFIFFISTFSITSFSATSKDTCFFEGDEYFENDQVVLDNKLLYCTKNSGGFLNFTIKLDELIKNEKEIIFGYNYCMFNNRSYLQGKTIVDGRFKLECIIIGYDYNKDAIYSFEIPGAKEDNFDDLDLLEMGLPNDYSPIDELLE